MSWIGRFELSTLVGIALFAVAGWIFLEMADEVFESDTRSIDTKLLLALRNPADLSDPLGPLWVEELVRDITALGSIAVLGLISLFVVGYLSLEGKRRSVLFVVAAVLGGIVISHVLKSAIDRPRPDIVEHATRVLTASFPSGHSTMAAVTYLTLGALLARVQARRRSKAYTLAVAIFVTLAVGMSRLYLGVHWPTDVVAGWTLGACWAILCWLVFYRLQRRGRMDPGGR